MKLRALAVLAAAAVGSCDPSGSTIISPLAANIRLINFVTDVPGLDLTADGRAIVTNLGFGQVSTYRSIAVEDSILVLLRHSDLAVIGTDSAVLINDRFYSYYVLGDTAVLKPRLVIDDTTFASAGNFKLRIINGVGTHAASALDFYASLPGDSLITLTPQMSSLAYGAAGPYIPTDTAFRRFRLTLESDTTVVFDTTLATAIADSSVVTMVVSDKQGGGIPFRFLVQIDKAP